jgi:leucyl-tRNA---protein transferase
MISIPLLMTQEHACSYLPDEQAQTAFVSPAFAMSTDLYSHLVQQGFRRSGDDVYAPRCPDCSACIPIRLKVQDFKPDRSQNRCLRKNEQVDVAIKPPEFVQAHFDLYLRYQEARHEDGNMRYSSPDDYLGFLASSWCDTAFVEFSLAGELVAVAVVDCLHNALSAVYTFYEPRLQDFSLGTYAVLWQIEWARRQRKDYLYLGYWIKTCQKMSYKARFRPFQMLDQHKWKEFVGEMPVESPQTALLGV